MNRRPFLLAALAAAFSLLLGQAQAAEPTAPDTLRIGYQKGSIALVLAKQHKLLEQRNPHTQVQWIEFPAGPQMLEALNIGSLDVASTGDLPPLFAQAAGADLVYIGAEPAKPQAETLLVPVNSPLHSVADLKGHKVALQRGSSSHNVLLRALAKAGLSLKDITPLYLAPADASAAFTQGSVDAWAIWDPYAALAVHNGQARVLADGTGLGLTGPLYTARRAYAQQYPEFIHSLLATLSDAEALTRSEREQSIDTLAASMGLDRAVVAAYIDHRPPSPVGPITEAIVQAQQHTADLFLQNKLLPKAVVVRDAVLPLQ
ncbi:aliphatic sulfonate ABC transporter substrate-binding protein [Pseudomonas sp. KNUC1026]|uniref:aliphatic sulfonate ABC transporter substrate-binding protein n=1 Tax=Pseudomonas sp. KNUC1026 TaxID=2893890 RepID=UPI001F269394|nr:aliphatic sulfonate ABC transporter substrate-binding protein [Pseudomonas sp. KNUC1026]UFH48328.1 aliphatic sulfonate ABC transporter substrate-binding protein [Pseudomonas sp. KNUC1026]